MAIILATIVVIPAAVTALVTTIGGSTVDADIDEVAVDADVGR